MPQAIEVEAQSEQRRLTLLHGQSASRCSCREFAFDDGENCFHLGSLAVELLRKMSPHLSTNSHSTAAAPLGRDDAARSEPLTNVLMVLFGVKFGVGQHQPDRRDATGRIDQPRQSLGNHTTVA